MDALAQTNALSRKVNVTLREYKQRFNKEVVSTTKRMNAIQSLCLNMLTLGKTDPSIAVQLRFTKKAMQLPTTCSHIYHLKNFTKTLHASVARITALCEDFPGNIKKIHRNLYILVKHATLYERIKSDMKSRSLFLYHRLISSIALVRINYPPETDQRPLQTITFKLAEIEQRVLRSPLRKRILPLHSGVPALPCLSSDNFLDRYF